MLLQASFEKVNNLKNVTLFIFPFGEIVPK
jgi:hypothetical protein